MMNNFNNIIYESGDFMNQTQEKSLPMTRNTMIYTIFVGILLVIASFIHGPMVFAIAGVSLIVALIIEWSFSKKRKKPFDNAWLATPLLIALMIPPKVPVGEPVWASLWLVGIASFVGVFFGKAIFGGTGKNIFNPAVVGLLFVTISFPIHMNTMWVDIPLANYGFTFQELLFGDVAGGIGETFRLGIIILGILLIALKAADWRIPLFYLLTVFLLTGLGFLIDPSTFKNPIISLLFGGLIFGAFFLATDPVTAPSDKTGKIIYAFGLGFLTVIIRAYAAFPEGVIFSIIIMNALAPLIDSSILERRSKKQEVTS
jgi:Na+-translocating ferredoxin:NAD+ oxidoreductase RnfD subunit